jgi:hypothetical protein
MNDPKKKLMLTVGLVLICVAAAGFAIKSATGGDVQSNVSDIAKGMDHTKSGSPSISPEQMALRISGGMKGGLKKGQ